MQSLPNTGSASPVLCWIALTRQSRIEVPRVDYEKLSGDRMGESSGSIRARVQAARDRQREHFSTLDAKLSIFRNADRHIGEIRQFCRLQACPERSRRDEGQCLMRAATSCCAWASSIYRRGAIIAREA
jgi:magnesium chelatase family protein